MKSADNPDSLVSVGLDFLLVTEAARVKEEAWEMALRPRLSSPGRAGLAVFNSTPKGRKFWRAYLKGQDPLEKQWESWTFPTTTNPHIDPAEITAAEHDHWRRSAQAGGSAR